jgi:hypothetical protein
MRKKRKIPAAFLLWVYMCGTFYPLTPLLKDMFEHIFHHAEHLAKVHHHHGHNHVHKEIQQAAKEAGHHTETVNENREIALHIFQAQELLLINSFRTIEYLLYPYSLPGDIRVKDITPPPRLLI